MYLFIKPHSKHLFGLESRLRVDVATLSLLFMNEAAAEYAQTNNSTRTLFYQPPAIKLGELCPEKVNTPLPQPFICPDMKIHKRVVARSTQRNPSKLSTDAFAAV